jgi:hypothetical protein
MGATSGFDNRPGNVPIDMVGVAEGEGGAHVSLTLLPRPASSTMLRSRMTS